MSWYTPKNAVQRRTPLPRGALQGNFIVTEAVVRETEFGLQTFRGPDGPHEGIVFWGGLQLQGLTVFTTAVIPLASHHAGGVSCDERSVLDAVRVLRSRGIVLLAQVHSHPGVDVRHSDGDDGMVFMPFEGMLSIVVPDYGRTTMRPVQSCGIHQFQKGSWTLCVDRLSSITVVPGVVDLR